MLSGYMHDENKLIKKKYKAGSSYDRDLCDDLCVYFPFLPVNASSPQLPLTLGKSLFVACFLKGMVWLFSCQASPR